MASRRIDALGELVARAQHATALIPCVADAAICPRQFRGRVCQLRMVERLLVRAETRIYAAQRKTQIAP